MNRIWSKRITKEQRKYIRAYWQNERHCLAAMNVLDSVPLDAKLKEQAHAVLQSFGRINLFPVLTALSFMEAAMLVGLKEGSDRPGGSREDRKIAMNMAGGFVAFAYKAIEQVAPAEQRLAALHLLNQRITAESA